MAQYLKKGKNLATAADAAGIPLDKVLQICRKYSDKHDCFKRIPGRLFGQSPKLIEEIVRACEFKKKIYYNNKRASEKTGIKKRTREP